MPRVLCNTMIDTAAQATWHTVPSAAMTTSYATASPLLKEGASRPTVGPLYGNVYRPELSAARPGAVIIFTVFPACG